MTTRREEKKDWASWIDEQIREAQERGQFDNLPGRGKPLDLTPNPHAGDREMAFKILRDAGYAPEWIELDKAIRGKLERARTALARAWTRHQESTRKPWEPATSKLRSWRPPAPGSQMAAERSLAAWQEAVVAFRQEVEAINREITELNLKVPSPGFQRAKVDAEREVQRLIEGKA